MAAGTILAAMPIRAMLILPMMLAVSASAQRATLAFRGCADLPEGSVQGLSGISRAGDSDTYWGAMDNSDRVVRLEIHVAHDGSIRSAKVSGFLKLPQKKDYEGIAFRGQSVLVSDESPADITEFRLADGLAIRTID